MTAICKTIDIHGGLSKLLDYGQNPEKTSLKDKDLEQVLDYAQNPLKTILELDDGDKSMLVTGILCTPETAEVDFSITKGMYEEKNGKEFTTSFYYKDKSSGKSQLVEKQPVTAVHLIQSFSEFDLDPRTVHQIGAELCERMGWQAVVDTHMNTGHYHNHIIINAYLPGGEKKVSMDKKMLLNIRTLSDEIQQEYGIDITFAEPSLQLQQSKRTKNYREWEMEKRNLSWKDAIRRDMLAARHVSTTKEEFIEIMKSYGYAIERQTEDNILWWNKQHTKKIWDRTLGDGYAINQFLTNEDAVPTILSTDERKSERHRTDFISISRYSWDGRRRSDLELLLRKAIAIIQKVKAFYDQNSFSYDYKPSKKLAFLNEAVDNLQAMHIDSIQTLSLELHDTGAALNHAKSELRTLEAQKNYYGELSRLVTEYEDAKTIYESVKLWNQPHSDLHLNHYTLREIQKNRAGISPITPSQKRDLYLAMKKHPEYRLRYAKKQYANISSMDATSVLRYFSKKSTQPYILITAKEAYYIYRGNMIEGTDNVPSSQKNSQENKAFESSIADESPKKQRVLSQYRNLANTLLSLGYDPKDIEGIKLEIAQFHEEYDSINTQKSDLSKKYKDLIRIRQQINFSKSESYLYGPMLAVQPSPSPTHQSPDLDSVNISDPSKENKTHSRPATQEISHPLSQRANNRNRNIDEDIPR